MNSVVLVGRLARDPEVRYTPQGTPVTRFTLAVDRPVAREEGKQAADFIPVVAWGRLGEVCKEHLPKGRLVAVRGRLAARSYEAADGKRRRAVEVVAAEVRFLSPKGWNGDAAKAAGPAAAEEAPEASAAAAEEELDFGDLEELLKD